MGEKEPGEEQKRRRADALIGDFISEREELREVPRFHVPPFVEGRIEGTRTVIYMPAEAGRVEAPGRMRIKVAPVEEEEPAAPESVSFEHEPAGEAEKTPLPPAAAPSPAPAAIPEPAAAPAPQPAPSPPSQAGPATQAPFEFPAKLMTGQSGPASYRRMYMRPDSSGPRKAALQDLPRRPSAKDLIARLRVVREGVETGGQAMQARPAAPAPPATARTAMAKEDQAPAAAVSAETAAVQPQPAEARLTPQTVPSAHQELEQKAEGGKLCPSCGSPISDRNRLLICTGCGKMNCGSCNRYDLAHMKSDIYYEYQFDFPLCIQCYGKAFSIQRLLGRAGVCYGNGNYSYALYYANQALEQDPESRYAPKARDIIDKTNKAHEQAQERDKEWRLQRKQFATSRPRQEDPSWR
jgi:hypothetical protein